MTDPQQDGPESAGWLAFAGLGLTVAAVITVGVLAGIWVDGRLHTAPLFLLVGMVTGASAATAVVIARVKRFM